MLVDLAPLEPLFVIINQGLAEKGFGVIGSLASIVEIKILIFDALEDFGFCVALERVLLIDHSIVEHAYRVQI